MSSLKDSACYEDLERKWLLIERLFFAVNTKNVLARKR
jgi:hypothetical protein